MGLVVWIAGSVLAEEWEEWEEWNEWDEWEWEVPVEVIVGGMVAITEVVMVAE